MSQPPDWQPPTAVPAAVPPSYPQYAYPPPPQPPLPLAPAPPTHGSGYGTAYPVLPPRMGLPRPVAVEAVPGTPFGLAIVEVKPTTSGPASASLVAGIASILVSLVVICFAAVGADGGWGALVAGAFAVLAALLAGAAIWLCWTGLRRMRRSVGWGATGGRGMALAGLICGLVGLALTALTMALAIAT